MSLLDLIQTKPEEARTAIFNALNNKAFDYFDNYKLDETVHQTVQESYNDDFDNEELDELDEGSGQKEKQHDKYVPLTQRTEIGRKVIADQKAKEPGKALLKKITKEDFETMSQEELDSIDEEQLDELSLATQNSYRNKKLKQGANTSNSSGVMAAYKKVQKIQNSTKPSQDAQTQGDLRGGKY